MLPDLSSVAVYLFALPVIALVVTLGLGALSLLLRVRWVPTESSR